MFQLNSDYVVKSTETFRQWEYRSQNGNGRETKKRRGDESRIIDLDDDDDEDKKELRKSVIEDPTCPFKEEDKEDEDEVGNSSSIPQVSWFGSFLGLNSQLAICNAKKLWMTQKCATWAKKDSTIIDDNLCEHGIALTLYSLYSLHCLYSSVNKIIKSQDEFILPPLDDLDPYMKQFTDEKTIPVIDEVDDEDDEDDEDEVRFFHKANSSSISV